MTLELSCHQHSVLPLSLPDWPSSSAFSVLLLLSSSSCAGRFTMIRQLNSIHSQSRIQLSNLTFQWLNDKPWNYLSVENVFVSMWPWLWVWISVYGNNSMHCFSFRSSDVFKICGTMQYLSGKLYNFWLKTCFFGQSKEFSNPDILMFITGVCLGIGILSFPAGWDNEEVRGVCGAEVR